MSNDYWLGFLAGFAVACGIGKLCELWIVSYEKRREKMAVDWVEEQIVRHEWTGNVDNISYGAILVRCKDCVKRPYDNCPFNEFSMYQPDDDFYCGLGSREWEDSKDERD